MVTFVASVLQYLLGAIAIFINEKFFHLTWWMWAIIVFILWTFSAYKAEEDKKNYVGNYIYILDAVMSCVFIIFFQTLKARIIIAFIAAELLWICGKRLENGDTYNNRGSNNNLFATAAICHALANIYYCVQPDTPFFSRLANIAFVLVAFFIASSTFESVAQVQNFDKEVRRKVDEKIKKQKELERQEREREVERQAEQARRIKEYEQSAFYQAMQIPYETMRNDKGIYGEYCTSTWITDITSKYRVLFSVCIPTLNDLEITEIDEIVIAANGINVIEVKNRKLEWLIDGEEKDACCTDQYKNLHQEKSPVWQNAKHISELTKFLQYRKKNPENVKQALQILNNHVNGYVVFGPDTISWKVANTNQKICNHSQIGNAIQAELNKLSWDGTQNVNWAIEVIYNFLKQYENDTEAKNKHDVLLKIKDWKRLWNEDNSDASEYKDDLENDLDNNSDDDDCEIDDSWLYETGDDIDDEENKDEDDETWTYDDSEIYER